MNRISKRLTIPVSVEKAFRYFVYDLNAWWPKEYTWSQEGLQSIRIDPRENGLCTEIGPHNFRCDWGRVVLFEPNSKIIFTWQISPTRVPEPNPEKASEVSVSFTAHGQSETIIHFEHSHFDKHGKGFEDYVQAMNSETGWDYILNLYATYCKNK